jgi:hypothetical protein
MANTIELFLDWYLEDGTLTQKLVTVNIGKPIPSARHYRYGNTTYTITYSVKIPDHVHKRICGETVARPKSGESNRTREYPKDFKQRFGRTDVYKLTEEWNTIQADYDWLLARDKAKLEKVIFYDFNGAFDEWNSSWNGVKIGRKNELKFRYAIGYVGEIVKRYHGKTEESRYNAARSMVNNSSDLYSTNYVKWTAEREQFFIRLQTSFERLINNVKMFEESLTEDTIEQLMAGNIKLLGD